MKKLLIATFLLLASTAHAIETGSEAPNFSLTSIDGKVISLKNYLGKIVVLEWFNPGCPFVRKHYSEGDMPNLQTSLKEKGVIWLTINSTNDRHKDFQDAQKASEQKEEWKINSTAILTDASGEVGKMYEAKTTPHMYVIDQTGKLVYQGAIDSDSSVFSSPKDANNYVKEAVEAVLVGKPVEVSESKPYGCSIKYAS